MNPIAIARIAGAVVFVLFLFGIYMKGRHDVQVHFDEFKATVKAVGEAQEARTRERITQDKQRKVKADEDNRRALDVFRAGIERLRRERAGGGQLPPAPADSGRPDLACYDRAELQRAYGKLVADVRRVADQCSEEAVNLNTAKSWAQQDH